MIIPRNIAAHTRYITVLSNFHCILKNIPMSSFRQWGRCDIIDKWHIIYQISRSNQTSNGILILIYLYRDMALTLHTHSYVSCEISFHSFVCTLCNVMWNANMSNVTIPLSIGRFLHHVNVSKELRGPATFIILCFCTLTWLSTHGIRIIQSI